MVVRRATRKPLEDRWARRARPVFLYVVYLLLLWSVPIGVLAAFNQAAAGAMIDGMGRYLSALPEPLYAVFATGYLGYTAARSWERSRER